MTNLSELTLDQGMEKAVTILLEHGWTKDEFYPTWKDYVKENEDVLEDEDLEDVLGYSIVWEALIEYTRREATDGELTARFVATQGDGLAHDSETYFVVLSLSDRITTRYFRRDGWYASYDGGHLEDGSNTEVFPQTKQVTVFEESK